LIRYHYWLLYRLPELPDPNNTPGNQLIAPVGKYFVLVYDYSGTSLTQIQC